MSKVRVYEVARDLGVENRELVQKIAALGIQVRNHMSVLEPHDADRIKRALDKERNQTMVEERIRPTVVRRRSVRKRAPEETPATPVEPVAATPAVEAPPAAEPVPEAKPEVAPTPAPEPEPQPEAEPAPPESAVAAAEPGGHARPEFASTHRAAG